MFKWFWTVVSLGAPELSFANTVLFIKSGSLVPTENYIGVKLTFFYLNVKS